MIRKALAAACTAALAAACAGPSAREQRFADGPGAAGAVAVLDVPPTDAEEGALLHDSEGRLSLSRLLARAAERNLDVRAARAAAEAWRQRRPQVTSLPDPSLRFGWFAGEIETRVGPQQYVVGLRQRIPWPGKLALEGDIADIQTDIARVKAWIAARDVLVEVVGRFYEYDYLLRAARVAEMVEELYARLAAVAAGGRDVGGTRLPEVIRAETLLAQSRNDRLLLAERAEVEAQRLRSMLDLAPSVVLGRPDAEPPPPLALSLETLERVAAEENQELLVAHLELRHAYALEKKAELRARPDFEIGGAYTFVNRNVAASIGDNGDDAALLEIGVTLPIWGHANRAARTEAYHRARERAFALDGRRRKLSADVANVHQECRNGQRLLELYTQTLLPQAERAARAAEGLLAEGTTGFAGVLETAAAWRHFELAALRARSDYAKSLANLERLLGVPLALLPATEPRPTEEAPR